MNASIRLFAEIQRSEQGPWWPNRLAHCNMCMMDCDSQVQTIHNSIGSCLKDRG
jgi:hypothetical protein